MNKPIAIGKYRIKEIVCACFYFEDSKYAVAEKIVATSGAVKRERWFQSDLSVDSERCNLVAPAPYDSKSQWHTIIFDENASSE